MTFFVTLKKERMRTAVLMLLLFVTLPLSFQCVKAPLEPKAPQWSIPLNIQLIDRKFTMGEMIAKDTTKFRTDSVSGSITYIPTSIVNQPTTIVLPELSPYQSSFSKALGALELDVPVIAPVVVTPGTLFPSMPLNVPLIGFPDTTVSDSRNIDQDSSKFDYFVFKNGRMMMKVKNSFPFTIRFMTPIQLVNRNQGGGVVATFTFASDITPGASDSSVKDVSGIKMSALLNMSYSVRAVGVAGTILRDTSKLAVQLVIDANPPDAKVSMDSASVAFSKDQPVDSIPTTAVQIVDDTTGTPTKIKIAKFKAGRFTISIVNNIATQIAAKFSLPEFVDTLLLKPFQFTKGTVNGTTLINARSTLVDTVVLAGYQIQSQDIKGNDTLSVRDIHYSLSITALKSTVGKVLITENDFVTVDITPMDNLQGAHKTTYVLRKVIGKVTPTFVPINTSFDAATGDIGNKFTADSINFDSVSIALNIFSSGSFPTDLKMKIIGLDNKGKRQDSLIARELKGGVLNDTLRLYPGFNKKIVFDKSTALPGTHGIDQFLSSFFVGGSGSLPQKFIVVGEAVVDPKSYYQYPESTGTVTAGDSVTTSVDFRFPVRLGIMTGLYKETINIADSAGININKDQLTSIDSGIVSFSVKNTFPFQLDVGTHLLKGLASDRTKPDTVSIFSLPKNNGVIHVESANYSSSSPARSTYTPINLTKSDIIDGMSPASFIAVAINLNTFGGDAHPVAFKNDYYVELKARVSVRFNVNFDKLGK